MRACAGATASINPAATRAGISSRSTGSSIPAGRPAEEMLEKYHGAWGGSVEPAYERIRVLGSASRTSLQFPRGFVRAVHPPYRFVAIKWRAAVDADRSMRANVQALKAIAHGDGRLLGACLVALALLRRPIGIASRAGARPRPISTVPAATIRARRSPPAIRPIARWCASATGAAAPGASTIRPTRADGAVCWLKNTVPARVAG